MKSVIYYIALLCVMVGCGNDSNENPNKNGSGNAVIPAIHYSVLRYFPHDTTSYTEGLLFHHGSLFESTGSPETHPHLRSVVGKVDLANGKIGAKIRLDSKKYFGEGIVFLNNKLFQLTYLNKVGFVYDANTYKLLDSFSIVSEEGWGLTTDGVHLIMSDGTSNISYLDTVNFRVTKGLRVTSIEGGTVDRLNELEYVNGFLYANIYTTNSIVKIDTGTGRIVGKLDLSSLYYEAKVKYRDAVEMNGIAYDAVAGTFYVTGKLWPNIYEISFPH